MDRGVHVVELKSMPNRSQTTILSETLRIKSNYQTFGRWHLGNLVKNFKVDIEKLPNAYYHKEGEEQRRVGIYICYYSFGNIVLHEHSYDCKFRLNIDWEPTKAELKRIFAAGKAKGIDTTMLDYIPWNGLVFTNSIDLSFSEPFGKPNLFWSAHHQKFLFFASGMVTGTFRENYELHNFPFDCQDLKLIIELGDATKQVWRHSGMCPVNVKVQKTNLSIQDYHLHDVFCTYSATKQIHSTKRKRYAEFHCVIKLQRRWEAYSVRMFLVISMVSLSSVASFLMDEDLFAERMAHTTTVMLTGIAFTFVVNNSLPVLPYLTYLDRYITCQILFTFSTGVMACLPQILQNLNDEDFFSNMAVIALCLWIAMHFVLLVDGLRRYCIETKKIRTYEPEYPDPKMTGPIDHARNLQMVDYPSESGNIWTVAACRDEKLDF